MTRDDFLNLPEWQIIAGRIREMINEFGDHALFVSKDFADVKEFSGRVIALGLVLGLPEQLLSDGIKKPQPELENVVELPNHPRTVRSAY